MGIGATAEGCPPSVNCVATSRLAHWLLHLLGRVMLVTLSTAVCGLQADDSAVGLEHLRTGRVDEALAVFLEITESQPDDASALNMVGAILCLKDDPEGSIPYFERALRHAPDFLPARKNLAMAEFESGLYEAAEANLQELLDEPEAQAQASLFLGMIASEAGRHEEAVRLLNSAADLVSSQPRAEISLARSLQQVGRTKAALNALANVRARSDLAGADLADVAQVAVSAGRFDEALSDLERAETLDTKLSGLGIRRVEILVKAGREDQALALSRQLAGRTPSRALLSLVADLSERAGDLDAAVIALRRAIQVEPEAEDGYIELAEFCVKYRNPELALEILDLGLSRMPYSYRLLVQKGITLGQGQRYEQASEALSVAIELTPEHSVALTALAVSLFLSGDIQKSLAALRSGVDRFPDDFYMHYIYGFVLDRSGAEGSGEGEPELAEKHLRRALELDEGFAPAYFRLGKLVAEREPDEAIRNLEAAVRLDPALVSAKYQLGQLYIDNGREEAGADLLREVGEAKQRELEKEQMPQFRAVKTE